MKSLKAALLVVALLPLLSRAQSSTFIDFEHATRGRLIPAVRVVRPADMLVAEVTIVATSRNGAEQSIAFNNALQLFRAEVGKTANVAIEQERTQQGGGEPSYLSSGKLDTNHTAAEVKVSFSLSGGIDSTGAAQVLRAMVARLKLPTDVTVRIASLRVEVRDPEALRDTLLKALAEESARLQTLFKSTQIAVTGLEHAVEQRPLSDREVTVFIPYTLSLGDKR